MRIKQLVILMLAALFAVAAVAQTPKDKGGG